MRANSISTPARSMPDGMRERLGRRVGMIFSSMLLSPISG